MHTYNACQYKLSYRRTCIFRANVVCFQQLNLIILTSSYLSRRSDTQAIKSSVDRVLYLCVLFLDEF